jgi:hypothetical protein
MKAIFFEDEEKDLLESYGRDEWKPVYNPRKAIKNLNEYARNTLQRSSEPIWDSEWKI